MSFSPSKAITAVLGLAFTVVVADPIQVIDQECADPSTSLQDGT